MTWLWWGYLAAAYVTALYGVRALGEKGQRALDERAPRRHLVYERQLSDVFGAVAVGLVWPLALFIASFNLAPKSRAERNAAMRAEHARLERELAEVQRRYERLTGPYRHSEDAP